MQSYSTLTCEKGVVNMAIKLRNKLPMELRKEKGGRKFKHRLKRYSNTHSILYRSSYQKDSRISKNLLWNFMLRALFFFGPFSIHWA
jgi:hypothetical protein